MDISSNEIGHCYYCGSRQHSFYAEENGFTLLKCDGCGLLYVANRPDDDELTHAHQQGQHRGLSNLTGTFSPAKRNRYIAVLEDIFKGDLSLIKTWLDVGCGHGEFIEAVQVYSSGAVSVKGTDPNIHKRALARLRGLDVGYFDLESHNEKYDVVSMLNVYSHLPDPPAFLKSIRKLLNPGGTLILETGDTAGLSAQDHYRPFYLPDHLSFASEAIVLGILKRLDFEILNVNKYPFVQFSLKQLAKEVIKLVLPGYTTRFRDLFKHSKTDMFIRAKLKS